MKCYSKNAGLCKKTKPPGQEEPIIKQLYLYGFSFRVSKYDSSFKLKYVEARIYEKAKQA